VGVDSDLHLFVPIIYWFRKATMMTGDVTNNSNVVRARLMQLIKSGLLSPDGRLPTERDLCAQLNVGRRAVRLALESIEAEGLVWRRQGKGTFAGQPPDPTGALAAAIAGETTVVEVMEARLQVEPALAMLCARRALPGDVERMRRLARRIREASDPDSVELWDGALHRLIARCAGNRPLLTMFALLDEVRGSKAWQEARSRARSVVTLRVTDREHAAIIDAIEAGDGDEAHRSMTAHLTTLMRNLKQIADTGGRRHARAKVAAGRLTEADSGSHK
jgi:GntR family transcriptional repressor for pyruvate dehydrogenase complex